MKTAIEIAGLSLTADIGGALFWAEERLLVISDLHLEKGSSFAARGRLLPPYDTGDSLGRLAVLCETYQPKTVITLGDNFHDNGGAERLHLSDRATLALLQSGRDWIWITGNHDPAPARGVGGVSAASVAIGPLTFRHEPERGALTGEIAGHLHPVARVAVRGRSLRNRCFVTNGQRIVMPAFGAYTGGLNVQHAAFAGLFEDFRAHVLGRRQVHAISGRHCLPD